MERQVAQCRHFKMFAVYSKSDGNLLESRSRGVIGSHLHFEIITLAAG